MLWLEATNMLLHCQAANCTNQLVIQSVKACQNREHSAICSNHDTQSCTVKHPTIHRSPTSHLTKECTRHTAIPTTWTYSRQSFVGFLLPNVGDNIIPTGPKVCTGCSACNYCSAALVTCRRSLIDPVSVKFACSFTCLQRRCEACNACGSIGSGEAAEGQTLGQTLEWLGPP